MIASLHPIRTLAWLHLAVCKVGPLIAKHASSLLIDVHGLSSFGAKIYNRIHPARRSSELLYLCLRSHHGRLPHHTFQATCRTPNSPATPSSRTRCSMSSASSPSTEWSWPSTSGSAAPARTCAARPAPSPRSPTPSLTCESKTSRFIMRAIHAKQLSFLSFFLIM